MKTGSPAVAWGRLGEAGVACPASPPRAVCGLHLPLPSSWWWEVGRGSSLCSQSSEAPSWPCPGRALGVGAWPGFWTRDTPEKLTPGGRSLLTPELPDGGGIANAKPPREFPFWKVGSSPFMTFSRGGGWGTGWAYGSDTICVMTSAPTRPLSSVNSGEGPGRQAAEAVGPGGGGSALAGVGICSAGSGRRGSALVRLAGLEPLGSRYQGSCDHFLPGPHSWLPKERTEEASRHHPGMAWVAPRPLLSGGPLVGSGSLSKASERYRLQAGSPKHPGLMASHRTCAKGPHPP